MLLKNKYKKIHTNVVVPWMLCEANDPQINQPVL